MLDYSSVSSPAFHHDPAGSDAILSQHKVRPPIRTCFKNHFSIVQYSSTMFYSPESLVNPS